jgi:phosphoribosylanthranilate isomerase
LSAWVKICGITSAAALGAAVDAGVDAVGFVFFADSPRNLSVAQAAALAAGVPRGVLKVAVTRRPAQALIDSIVAGLAPDLLQTDAEDLGRLRLPASLRPLPVLRPGRTEPSPLPPRCLLDATQSGAGERTDWTLARSLAPRTQLILAGGLNAANVAAAIGHVRPFGVDVSSGVESAPGVKDAAMIHEFVAAVRAASAQTVRSRESIR